MMTPPGDQTVTKKVLTCGQLRNIQRYQKYVRLVRAFFLELRTCSSQQCLAHSAIRNFQAKDKECGHFGKF